MKQKEFEKTQAFKALENACDVFEKHEDDALIAFCKLGDGGGVMTQGDLSEMGTVFHNVIKDGLNGEEGAMDILSAMLTGMTLVLAEHSEESLKMMSMIDHLITIAMPKSAKKAIKELLGDIFGK